MIIYMKYVPLYYRDYQRTMNAILGSWSNVNTTYWDLITYCVKYFNTYGTTTILSPLYTK